MRPRHSATALAVATLLLCGGTSGDAHKPILSPFTFSHDVLPIVQARCGSCHVSGGVAPMSLLTYADAVPWAESMRTELIAGHMPPSMVDGPPTRFRNVTTLTARELNVLLTWATGGTPPGDPSEAPAAAADVGWRMGPPDAELPLPDVSVPADTQDEVVTLVVPAGVAERRWLRGVDLRPGNPAIVRSAQITVRDPHGVPGGDHGAERLLALWQPGAAMDAAGAGAAFELPAGAEVVVAVRYRKTWQYERKALTDRSTLGLYFTSGPVSAVEALAIASRTTLSRATRVLGIYPDPTLSQVRTVVTAMLPDGRREDLLTARPQRAWARRYWYAEPPLLPRGTTIDVRIEPYDESALLPPGATPVHDVAAATVTRRVVLDTVPE